MCHLYGIVRGPSDVKLFRFNEKTAGVLEHQPSLDLSFRPTGFTSSFRNAELQSQLCESYSEREVDGFALSNRKLELHCIRNQLLLNRSRCCIRRCIAGHGACFGDGR